MGIEVGSVMWYEGAFYLFMGYEVNDFIEYYKLRGVEGDLLVSPEKCTRILSPMEA